MLLHIRPIGEVEKGLLDGLKDHISSIFSLPVKIDPAMSIPSYAYNPDRGQYEASTILADMMMSIPSDGSKVLGIIDKDIYVKSFNFIFGLAAERVAVISLTRLREEYYGFPPNEFLFKERILKEAIHEIGHMIGLVHCPDIGCVMHFSNTLDDTDIKGCEPCARCKALL